jgi:hypothetical protein
MDSLYSLSLFLHSWLRWAIILLGLVAVIRALGGRSGRPWSQTDTNIGKWLTITFDVQLLLGILLYVWLSPITQAAFADFGGAMRNSVLRFWAVEHIMGMVIATALAHVGRAKIRKAANDRRRHTLAAVYYGIALIIMLASIPWPGRPAVRPLFRGL